MLQRFSGEIKRQFAHRGISGQQLRAIRSERANHQRAAIFYCSSAGEYEQALPVIDRLGPDWYIHIFFSSVSGVEYATALEENRPFHLSPVEGLQRWERVFNAIQPELVVVTRHGLWPAFLYTARQYAQLVAIDVAVRDNSGGLSRRIKTWLLNWFDRVFFVSEEDRRLLNDLQVPSQIAGNTKFDRAADRKSLRADQAARLATEADRLLLPGKRLIAGSAWREDVEVILEAHRTLTGMEQEEWRLILVPHDVSPTMINWMEQACLAAGLSVTRYSQKERAGQPTKVLIVDTIGLLFELYAGADVALIGGGFQQGIHNLVEPAVFGLPLIAGPLAGSDREAMLYRSANLL
ncbi:MAG: glycosyltransferase N-terminal domain-containing protein, partial [Bacteroidota bacterium]